VGCWLGRLGLRPERKRGEERWAEPRERERRGFSFFSFFWFVFLFKSILNGIRQLKFLENKLHTHGFVENNKTMCLV
jgi:hypothetical protein